VAISYDYIVSFLDFYFFFKDGSSSRTGTKFYISSGSILSSEGA